MKNESHSPRPREADGTPVRKYRNDGEYMLNRDLDQIMADHYDTPWQELPRKQEKPRKTK